MRLLTEGGTPLAAMHKYAPISDLVTLVNDNIPPSTDCTKKMKHTIHRMRARLLLHFLGTWQSMTLQALPLKYD
jgi:hypothetical protein